MKKKKLYLHIGAPKTGSTAIQHFIFFNKDRWNEEGFGIYYPLNMSEIDENTWEMAIHFPNFRIKKIDNFISWSIKNPYKAYILSDESLYFNFNILIPRKEIKLSLLFRYFDVTFILYLRNIDDFTLSMYKWGSKFLMYNGSYHTFLSNILTLDKKHFLQSLLKRYPTSKIKIRSYDFLKHNSLFLDFVDACDCKRTDWNYMDLIKNTNISLDVCSALLHLKKSYGLHSLPYYIENGLTQSAIEISNENIYDKNEHPLDYTERYKLCRKYDEYTKWIENTFMDGDPLFKPLSNRPVWQEDVNKTYILADLIKKKAENKGFIFPDNSIIL